MAISTHIAATADAQALGDVVAISLDGLAKINATGLAGAEEVVLHEEVVGGGYQVVKSGGEVVRLTATQPSVMILAKGEYKCTKTATTAAVAVGYEA